MIVHQEELCDCAAYRASEMGAPIVHRRGTLADSGNCMNPAPWSRQDHIAAMHAARRAQNVHSEPSVVNRLVRLLEEIIEAPEHADMNWYAKQLRTIKAEINEQAMETGGDVGSERSETEAGLGDRADTEPSPAGEAVSGEGGFLSRGY